MRPRRGRKYQFVLKTRNASVCDGELLVVTQTICSSQPSLCTTRQTKSLFFFSLLDTLTHCVVIVVLLSAARGSHSRNQDILNTFGVFPLLKINKAMHSGEKKSLSSGSGHNPNGLVQCVTEHHRSEKKHCFFLLLLATLSKARHQPSVMS